MNASKIAELDAANAAAKNVLEVNAADNDETMDCTTPCPTPPMQATADRAPPTPPIRLLNRF